MSARTPLAKTNRTKDLRFRPLRRKPKPDRITATGEIETFTVLYVTPEPFLPPLGLALVRDQKGSRIMAQAEDITQLKLGQKVYLRKVGGIYYCTLKSRRRRSLAL